jgi:hypothetical protein
LPNQAPHNFSLFLRPENRQEVSGVAVLRSGDMILGRTTLKRFASNALLLAISLAISLGIAEMLLRCFTPFPIHSEFANRIPHAELGYVMDPRLKDIDEKGFRNQRAIADCDIVAVGDSHTYGYNVSREESWPDVLSTISGRPVYNFGIGGYGAGQYAYLIREATNMHARDIIIGFYLPNEISDYMHYKSTALWRRQLKTVAPATPPQPFKNPCKACRSVTCTAIVLHAVSCAITSMIIF